MRMVLKKRKPEMSPQVVTLFAMRDISSCQLLAISIRAFHQSLHFSLARLSKHRQAPFLKSGNSEMVQSLLRYKMLTRQLPAADGQDYKIGNIPIKILAHKSLNYSKGVIKCKDLTYCTDDEILKELFLHRKEQF